MKLSQRYSKPNPHQLCYTCKHAEEFDILNPLHMGYCTFSVRECIHAKVSCKHYEHLPGQSWN